MHLAPLFVASLFLQGVLSEQLRSAKEAHACLQEWGRGGSRQGMQRMVFEKETFCRLFYIFHCLQTGKHVGYTSHTHISDLDGALVSLEHRFTYSLLSFLMHVVHLFDRVESEHP
jgi:hypothetical protein